jgi:hypothetical protein
MHLRIVIHKVVITVLILLLLPTLAFAQSQEDLQVAKTGRSENFVIPYTATNRNEQDPLVYTFDAPLQPNWILSIQNNLSYVSREGARTIIKLQEPAPSEKFIELAIYGDQSMRYWVAVNTPEAGYARMYDSITHSQNSGLIVTNGQRTVVDRLDLGGFAVSSIQIYGNDGNSTLANAYAGDIIFQVFYGNIEESPLYFVPAAVGMGVAGVVISLLIFKKRKPSDYNNCGRRNCRIYTFLLGHIFRTSA